MEQCRFTILCRGRVRTGSLGSCEPVDFRIFAEEPMKFDIKSDPSRIVNPWIEISNVAPVFRTPSLIPGASLERVPRVST